MDPRTNNIGAYLEPEIANGEHTIVAGASLDGVKVTGETIDRIDFNSLVLETLWVTTLAITQTFSITIGEQQSDDDSDWDTETVVQAVTVAATGLVSAGATYKGLIEDDINLTAKKRYVRYNITPTLSASGTDTAAFLASVIKGGAVSKPA